MSFPFTVVFDSRTRAAEAIVQLCQELALGYGAPIHPRFGGGLFLPINSGQIGNEQHQEGLSRHNRADCPDGWCRICALDVSGPASTFTALAEFHRACWIARLMRIARWGFSQRGDGRGLSWDTGDWKWTGRDQGHCHFDITMLHPFITVTDDYVPAWLDASWWGVIEFVTTGQLQPGALGGLTVSDIADLKAYIDLSQNRNIKGDVVPRLIAIDAQVKALRAEVGQRPFYRRGGTSDVWTPTGAGRGWISWITYHLAGEPVVDTIPSTDPFWTLPAVGPQPDALVLRQVPGDPVSYLVQGGVRLRTTPALLSRFRGTTPVPTPADVLGPIPEVTA